MSWWAVGLSVMATQISAITFVSTTGQGLRGRDAVPGHVLRPALRHGHPLRDPGALLLSRGCVHRLRVPREAIRRAHPDPHEPALPAVARPLGGGHPLRSVPRALGDPGLERAGDDPDHGRHHHRLCDLRGQPLRDLDRRGADGPHLARHLRLRRGRGLEPAPGGGVLEAPGPGKAQRAPAHHGSLSEPDHALHPLGRPHRRPLPHAGLLRVRSEPGAAVSLGAQPHGEPALPALQRLPEGADAVPDPAHRRARVRLLPLRRPAASLEPRPSRAAWRRSWRRQR